MSTQIDRRALAQDLLLRAQAEVLPNVRANYQAAAARWTAIADREEELDRIYAEKRASMLAKVAPRTAGVALTD